MSNTGRRRRPARCRCRDVLALVAVSKGYIYRIGENECWTEEEFKCVKWSEVAPTTVEAEVSVAVVVEFYSQVGGTVLYDNLFLLASKGDYTPHPVYTRRNKSSYNDAKR